MHLFLTEAIHFIRMGDLVSLDKPYLDYLGYLV